MIGDMDSDTGAGRNAGCSGTVLVQTEGGPAAPMLVGDAFVEYAAPTLLKAAKTVIAHSSKA